MLNLAVVGKDVSRSQSPELHAFLLDCMGESCRYLKVSIPPEEFEARAKELFAFDGFNVTVPFKQSILSFLRKVEGDAAVFGAVNTVRSAEKAGYNTDGGGFSLMLETEGVPKKGVRALVLGAGGAGRSVIKTLSDGGAQVFAYERDAARLREVEAAIGGFTPLAELPREAFGLIVNCTGVGMHDTVGRSPADRELLSRCEWAVDLIYDPPVSEFLRLAREENRHILNGKAMLFYQAYLSDCIYLGREKSAEEAKEFWLRYRNRRKR